MEIFCVEFNMLRPRNISKFTFKAILSGYGLDTVSKIDLTEDNLFRHFDSALDLFKFFRGFSGSIKVKSEKHCRFMYTASSSLATASF